MTDQEDREQAEPEPESPASDEDVTDIGTEPVGESGIVNIGTEPTYFSEPPSGAVHVIGTEVVGKSEKPPTSAREAGEAQDE